MFEHHRKSPWFAEKYDPSQEFVNLRTRLRREGWKGRLGSFLVDLEIGKYDPSLNEQEQDPATPAKEASANGALSENPEIASLGPAGPDTEETKPAVDEEMQNVDGDEEGGENETGRQETNGRGPKDSKHNNRGEEVSVMPDGNQVMIRTIPPDIGRLRLEEVCAFIFLRRYSSLHVLGLWKSPWLYILGSR
jgi:SERRATE/Ars2, N-terminal domain